MNKDVIYIEPEDDITDIINRLKTSQQKVVALVPPSKPSVLRSAVNIKLVQKTATEAGKTAVIVTTDQALVKLSANAGIPVAKTLQSRPTIPSADAEPTPDNTETIDEATADDADAKDEVASQPAKSDDKEPDQVINSAELEEDLDNKKSKKDKSGNKKIPNFDKYRKWIIIGVAGVILLIGFLVWALVFAPAAKIIVSIRTTANNFSENVSFTFNQGEEDLSASRFYLEEHKLENKSETEMEATGKKNLGSKASGRMTVTYSFSILNNNGSFTVPDGTIFQYGSLQYVTTEGVTLNWGGSISECGAERASLLCNKSGHITVEAVEPGEAYNIGAHSGEVWTSNLNVTAKNDEPFSGGTDRIVTVVQQSDIDKAKDKISTGTADEGKEKLLKDFPEGIMPIEASFKQTAGDLISTPALGEVVEDGVTPKLSTTTTFTMYGIDQSHLEEYIKDKGSAKIADDQRIYDTGNPFFERFVEADGAYTAKLKTTIQFGPKVTEQDILEKSKGRKIGEVQTLIKSINGVSSVKVEPSFFWVRKVPNDENKITIELKVEE